MKKTILAIGLFIFFGGFSQGFGQNTATPTNTATNSPTNTPTNSPTNTPTITPTMTFTPIFTPTYIPNTHRVDFFYPGPQTVTMGVGVGPQTFGPWHMAYFEPFKFFWSIVGDNPGTAQPTNTVFNVNTETSMDGVNWMLSTTTSKTATQAATPGPAPGPSGQSASPAVFGRIRVEITPAATPQSTPFYLWPMMSQ